MTIQALNNFTPVWFTPAGQDGDAQITRFQIRGLTGYEQAQLMPELKTDPVTGDVTITPTGGTLMLQHGLLAWENFSDNAGAVEFRASAKRNQERLPIVQQNELISQIFELTFLPAEVKKK